mmetsp:Transcript_9564/g.26028  ORF Transcript_9564/g.26028 Transcript_9564/m.26028 type:complete len:121 (-) Transcript_9564:363-725(-)|eukprot:CAMPEP_0198113004 /NCGR_PEP_ID=MMETSP1442-20131203/4767_1 /TAXON_ID= /ORGANISM="Craspedostauros australis, Strain CCMP3328" /LENGTH=120 /DNA_ID=CAMNT_0043769973 /DNA_START=1251 /DNA_END=1613 /DNA_ORIENTATION=+
MLVAVPMHVSFILATSVGHDVAILVCSDVDVNVCVDGGCGDHENRGACPSADEVLRPSQEHCRPWYPSRDWHQHSCPDMIGSEEVKKQGLEEAQWNSVSGVGGKTTGITGMSKVRGAARA